MQVTENEDDKRKVLRDACDALDGPHITILLHLAARMLVGRAAMVAV